MFSWFIFGLFDLISAPPLPLSQIGCAIVLLCFVCFAESLYLGFRVWNNNVTLARAEHCMFLSLVLQDYRIPVCAQLLVMIVIAGRLLLLGFVFKPVSWLARDSRLRQTFSLRIHLVERQSLSSICPWTIISYLWSLAASLSTSASRSIPGPIVFSLDRNKPVTTTLSTSLTFSTTSEGTPAKGRGIDYLLPDPKS